MIIKNLKIRSKLVLAFSIVIIFLVFITGVGVSEISIIAKDGFNLYQQNLKPLETLGKLKDEFAELRRLFAATIIRGSFEDYSEREAAVKAMYTQYDRAAAAGKIHLDKLVEVGAPQSRIDTTAAVLKSMSDDYKPILDRVAEAAMIRNTDAMYAEMGNATASADYILDIIDVSYTSSMVIASDNTEGIQNSSENAMSVLLVTGVIAVIISLASAVYIGVIISKPIIELREATKEIVKGNLNLKLSSDAKDELGDLTNDLALVISTVSNVTTAITNRIDEFRNGGLAYKKIDTSLFEGSFKVIVESVNDFIDGSVNDVIVLLNCVDEFSNGNFSADIQKLPGDKIIMNETLDSIRDRLRIISKNINILVNAATAGRLAERISDVTIKGDWAEIMNSLNRLMEAVASPIQETKKVLEQVAQGNFEEVIIGSYQGEFLQMKISINDMVRNIAAYIDEISNVLGALSQNNLDQSIEREYVGEFSNIKNALNNIIDKYNHVISNISAAADQVSVGVRQISESSMTLAQGTAVQASSVEELNDTILLISYNTAQNAENAKSAKKMSERSKENAAKGDREMEKMLISMQSIKESSSSIYKIIKVIDEIAFQTNLLSLNAAVEAARAGVQGKGFSVVAEEVRNLAGKSKEAAKEITQLIEESINKVNGGTQMAGVTAQAFQTIVENVTVAADIVTGIAEASEEQVAAISQVTEGLSQITDVVQNNSATSEETAAASEELSSQAELLRNMVSVFKVKRN